MKKLPHVSGINTDDTDIGRPMTNNVSVVSVIPTHAWGINLIWTVKTTVDLMKKLPRVLLESTLTKLALHNNVSVVNVIPTHAWGY